MIDNRSDITSEYKGQSRDIKQWRSQQIAEAKEQAKKAKAETRKQASDIEKKAQIAAKKARAAEREEQRKKGLPYTKPEELETEEKLAAAKEVSKETAKKVQEAYKEIEKEEAGIIQDVKVEAEKALEKVEEAKAKTLAEYDKAAAKFDKQYVEVAGDDYVERKEFEKLGNREKAYLKKHGIDRYNEWAKKQQKPLGLPLAAGKAIFKKMKGKGDIPKGAKYIGIDPETGKVKYREPDTRTGKEIFVDMIAKGMIPKESTFVSYDKKTGKVTYKKFRGVKEEKKPKVKIDLPEHTAKSGVGKAVDDAVATLGISPEVATGLATAAGIAAITPIPHDDAAVWGSIGTLIGVAKLSGLIGGSALAGYFGKKYVEEHGLPKVEAPDVSRVMESVKDTTSDAIRAFQKSTTVDVPSVSVPEISTPSVKVPEVKIPSRVTEAVEAFKEKTGEFPSMADAVITDATGNFAITAKNFSDIIRPLITPVYKGTDVTVPPKTPVGKQTIEEATKPSITPAYLQQVAPMITPAYRGELVITFPTPTINPADVTKKANTLLSAAEGVQEAQKQVAKEVASLPKRPPTELPVNWNRLLENVHKGEVEKAFRDINKANVFRDIQKALETYKPEQARRFNTAYKEYLEKKNALDNAKEAYSASLAPQPVTGKLTEKAASSVTGMMLAKQITESRINNLAKAGEITSSTSPSELTNSLTNVYTSLQDLVDTDVVTSSQLLAGVQGAIQNAVDTKTLTQPQAELANKIATKTLSPTRTASRTIPRTLTKTLAMTLSPSIPKTPPKVPFPSIVAGKPKHKLTEKEKAGSVAWKQGFIYKLVYPPYGKENIINTREPIPGVKYYDGPKSAYMSIVKLNGKIPYQILRDMGIMDVRITRTEGKPKISFERDMEQESKLSGKVRRTRYSKKKKYTEKPSTTAIVVSRLVG